ncbi:hypothetical protein MKW98_009389 [Papaver atlanticum]|uniref:Uncharacterized protein n=1 Tax=Papaver atlanticum TaxID=357466 RepID=A0AAD4RZ44_9MAGN|nr:hypothetical protein MKW98_009389 [Papaver atlanticum]
MLSLGRMCFRVFAIPAVILSFAMESCAESPQWFHFDLRSSREDCTSILRWHTYQSPPPAYEIEETVEPTSVSVGFETVESMTDVIEMEQTGLRRRVRFAIDNESERDERFETDVQLREKLEDLLAAQQAGSAFILGHSYLKVKHGSSIFKRATIDVGYNFLSKNCRGPDVVLRVPHVSSLEVGMVYIV